ncbi:hypothetical protein Tco_0510636 [Tanacetum coccineum]
MCAKGEKSVGNSLLFIGKAGSVLDWPAPLAPMPAPLSLRGPPRARRSLFCLFQGRTITDRITRALTSDTVKNPKLNVNSTSPVLSARSYPVEDPQCSARIYNWINAITIYPKKPSKHHDDKPGENEIAKTGATDEDHHAMVRVESEHKKSEEEEREEEGNTENINTDSPSQPDPLISFIT